MAFSSSWSSWLSDLLLLLALVSFFYYIILISYLFILIEKKKRKNRLGRIVYKGEEGEGGKK